MEIRRLRPEDDRNALSRIYEESWRFAYSGIIPQDYLDSIPKGQWAASADKPNISTLVLVADGEMVGTASFCPSRFEDMAGWGEIVSIYLLPDHMGKGYGKMLFAEAVRGLEEMGFRDIFLWVLEENTNARRFYERQGFVQNGKYLDDNIGGKPLREIQYVRKNGD
ncbi:MAG: GNAT family N-acetyltransferase [Oscillospiraceae bacterium]|nr:GNAT family N-acetyltransferase [Oscillospiraceae bacterium]